MPHRSLGSPDTESRPDGLLQVDLMVTVDHCGCNLSRRSSIRTLLTGIDDFPLTFIVLPDDSACRPVVPA